MGLELKKKSRRRLLLNWEIWLAAKLPREDLWLMLMLMLMLMLTFAPAHFLSGLRSRVSRSDWAMLWPNGKHPRRQSGRLL